ncbi:MAG: chemotaxis protein CheW [Gemmatimonadota bacterium]|nr:chemotaxis protein CheW [Gemmatimonadota bacterium]
MSESTQYCTFLVDDLYFGIEVMKVQEVIREQQMTRVPLAPATVSGLINLRGQIVTAVDLRVRLGLPRRPAEKSPMNVIVRTEDGAVSLMVDEIGDVIETSAEMQERPPETLVAAARAMITSVYKLPDRLLLALDIDAVLATEPVGAGGR